MPHSSLVPHLPSALSSCSISFSLVLRTSTLERSQQGFVRPLRPWWLWFPILIEGTAPAHTSLASRTISAGRTSPTHPPHLPESTAQQREWTKWIRAGAKIKAVSWFWPWSYHTQHGSQVQNPANTGSNPTPHFHPVIPWASQAPATPPKDAVTGISLNAEWHCWAILTPWCSTTLSPKELVPHFLPEPHKRQKEDACRSEIRNPEKPKALLYHNF